MKTISYIFTVPACILFWIAEKIRGEKVVWRTKELKLKCSKCGHIGDFSIK